MIYLEKIIDVYIISFSKKLKDVSRYSWALNLYLHSSSCISQKFTYSSLSIMIKSNSKISKFWISWFYILHTMIQISIRLSQNFISKWWYCIFKMSTKSQVILTMKELRMKFCLSFWRVSRKSPWIESVSYIIMFSNMMISCMNSRFSSFI